MKIEDCLNFLASKTYQRLSQLAKPKLSKLGITTTQCALLHVLWEQDGLKGIELGERLRIDGATITGMLDRLEQNGIIERRPDSRDRRINLIFLTEQGKELEGPVKLIMKEVEDDVLNGFSEQEVALFKKMMTLIGLEEGK
ncbi:MarR family winged helix-turn-helix transcriptional regulator [Brevibacillus migulae]|uniref:MarR family winged helix-turn-helix transcriptional regulator n=1 Tax=Brevibacillus migulae TaxID=1644114 RepID=UPI00106EF2EC|nr:MarR family transcriptional regulator [Brevibacillus migulae]